MRNLPDHLHGVVCLHHLVRQRKVVRFNTNLSLPATASTQTCLTIMGVFLKPTRNKTFSPPYRHPLCT